MRQEPDSVGRAVEAQEWSMSWRERWRARCRSCARRHAFRCSARPLLMPATPRCPQMSWPVDRTRWS